MYKHTYNESTITIDKIKSSRISKLYEKQDYMKKKK